MTKYLLLAAVLGLTGASAQTSMYVQNSASAKTATLIVNAGQGGTNGGLNFNGADHGKKSFTVPAGWTVKLVFKNVGAMPHSALVAKGSTPPAVVNTKAAAFKGAYTSKLIEGLPGGSAAQTVTFKATTAGTYNIVCGVPGHNLGGQYLGLLVSKTAKVASYN